MKMNQLGKGNDCFRTPTFIFEQLNDIFNFTLDVACETSNCLCKEGFYFDLGKNALNECWGGGIEHFVIHLLA